jgi:hypothetical protein
MRRIWRTAILAIPLLLTVPAWADGGPTGTADKPPIATLEPLTDVKVEITSLARLPNHPEVVELRFDVVNQSQDAVSLRELGVAGLNNYVAEPLLFDLADGKIYRVGGDGDRWSFSTALVEGGTSLRPGMRRGFWAWYKPPVDATKIGIFMPGIPPVLDVPIAAR